MNKQAYEVGVQKALQDLGITKQADQEKTALGSMYRKRVDPELVNYLREMAAGAGLGAGVGAAGGSMMDDTDMGRGALRGALAGASLPMFGRTLNHAGKALEIEKLHPALRTALEGGGAGAAIGGSAVLSKALRDAMMGAEAEKTSAAKKVVGMFDKLQKNLGKTPGQAKKVWNKATAGQQLAATTGAGAGIGALGGAVAGDDSSDILGGAVGGAAFGGMGVGGAQLRKMLSGQNAALRIGQPLRAAASKGKTVAKKVVGKGKK